jgi:hypothetical protein
MLNALGEHYATFFAQIPSAIARQFHERDKGTAKNLAHHLWRRDWGRTMGTR